MAKCCLINCNNPGLIEFHSHGSLGPKGYLICFRCMIDKSIEDIKSEIHLLPHVSADVVSGELVDEALGLSDWEDDMFGDDVLPPSLDFTLGRDGGQEV